MRSNGKGCCQQCGICVSFWGPWTHSWPLMNQHKGRAWYDMSGPPKPTTGWKPTVTTYPTLLDSMRETRCGCNIWPGPIVFLESNVF
jgi:hypothetical protein